MGLTGLGVLLGVVMVLMYVLLLLLLLLVLLLLLLLLAVTVVTVPAGVVKAGLVAVLASELTPRARASDELALLARGGG